ncbi:MAG: hypothetical protein Q8942_09525 [Bacillota bacterium]|nr:hypothetical protein [Bacillota bacterium]
MENGQVVCPSCNNSKLTAKYEAKYIYSYIIDTDAPGLKNKYETLPFMYDKRDQVEARQYIECDTCGAKYPCFFSQNSIGIDFKVLQKAIKDNQM